MSLWVPLPLGLGTVGGGLAMAHCGGQQLGLKISKKINLKNWKIIFASADVVEEFRAAPFLGVAGVGEGVQARWPFMTIIGLEEPPVVVWPFRAKNHLFFFQKMQKFILASSDNLLGLDFAICKGIFEYF